MAVGLVESSGAWATPDVRGGGDSEWAAMTGMSPESPMVGGPRVAGLGPYDVDRNRGAISTLPGASEPWTGAGVGIPGVETLDDWRDLFNFRGSPMPWLLLFALVALGIAQLSIAGRVGPLKAAASAG
ncbi:MAG TPA: hypothetical protein VFR97_04970 [Capillimicrobium sp.]|nr:hypothetical protein [Capillimicrobium sp.]